MDFAQANTVPGGNAPTVLGAELEEVTTSSLGFKAISGDVKLRLFPSPWPADRSPPTTSSLLSVSSIRGLLAAAGPDTLVVASTDTVRKTFSLTTGEDNTNNLKPELSIPVPRLSHVAFTSDGSCLIIAAEQGGGLAIHSVDNLLKNNSTPVIELTTEGVAIRALVPNPAKDLAHLVAVVMSNGHLMIANLQERAFARGLNNQPSLKDGVRSVAWSLLGKQLVAGLQDGTAVQMEPTGSPKAIIPRPPGVASDFEVSTIIWTARDEYIMVHSERSPSVDAPPQAVYHWVRTDKDRTQFEYRTFMEPNFALHSRVPASLLTGRLRKWHTLEDAIIIASAASPDIGLLTYTKAPLMSTSDPDKITNQFTITTMFDDPRKAVLPMSVVDDMADTFPIGIAVDLSSKDKVYQPIPGDDVIVGDSPHPLPAVLVLNQECFLCYWWFVYDAALKADGGSVAYPELVAQDTAPAAQFARSPSAASPPATALVGPSAFGSAAFGAKPSPWGMSSLQTASAEAPSPFGSSVFKKPEVPAFGTPSLPKASLPAFGTPSLQSRNLPAPFGSSAPMGGSQSPWGSSTTTTAQAGGAQFGKSAFGTPGKIGAFGAASGLGQTQSASPWGTQATSTTNEAAKRNPFGAAAAEPSGFAKMSSPATATSPFGAISGSTASPFAQTRPAQPAWAASSPPGSSLGTTPQPSFGSTVTIDSSTAGSTIGSNSLFGSGAFGQPTQPKSLFGQPSLAAEKSKDLDMSGASVFSKPPEPASQSAINPFSKSDKPFTIESTFRPDATSVEKDKSDGPAASSNLSFASGFSSLLSGDTGSQTIKSEPQEEKRNLFDIPQKPFSPPALTQTPASPEPVRKSSAQDPEPPQVTSKPMPSPTTAASSGTSSAKSSIQEKLPSISSSPHLVEHPESEGYSSGGSESALSESDPEPHSDDESDDDASGFEQTPNREEPQRGLPSSSKPSWMPKSTPEASPPQNGTSVLRSHPQASASPFGRPSGSATPLIDSIPPPAPTPPVVSNTSSNFFSKTTTPAGLPQPAFQFPPPRSQGSPRSPSPVRKALAQSTVAQPGATVRESPLEEVLVEPEEEALSTLSDDEDERIRRQLSAPIEPTLELAPFLAHQDYVGHVTKEGLSGHIERIYRDINSMVDTLGLNARSLASFADGQRESDAAVILSRVNLDDDGRQWRMDEIFILENIQAELEQSVDQGRITEVLNALSELAALARDVAAMKKECASLRRHIEIKKSPDLEYKRKVAPLDPVWASSERKLRANLAEFQKRIAEAEDKATVLRAKIASRSSKGMPTVEAVENTIRKMLGMVEKRSGDIDVLEMHMRKLGLVGNGVTPVKKPGASELGRTLALTDEDDAGQEDDEKEEVIARALDLRARRRVVLAQLREGLVKRNSEPVSSMALSKAG